MSDAAWAGFLDSLESELHASIAPRGRLRRQACVRAARRPRPAPGELADRARTILAEVGRLVAGRRQHDAAPCTATQLDSSRPCSSAELRTLSPRRARRPELARPKA